MAGSSGEGRDAETVCRERNAASSESASDGATSDVTRLPPPGSALVLTAGQLTPLARMIAWDLLHGGDVPGQSGHGVLVEGRMNEA